MPEAQQGLRGLATDGRSVEVQNNRTGASVDRLIDKLKKLLAVYLSIRAIGSIFEAAAKVEATRMAFEGLTHSVEVARDLFISLKAIALESPFQFDNLREGAQLLLALGYSAKEVVPILKTVVDTSSALGGDPERLQRILLAIGQIRSAGRLMGTEMKQLAEAGVNAWGYLGKALGLTSEQLRAMVEKGLIPSSIAIQIILKGMADDFTGMSARASQTLAGLWNNAKESIFFTAADIGQSLVDAFNIKGLISTGTAAFTEFGKALGDALRIISGLPTKFSEVAAMANVIAAVLQGIVGLIGAFIAFKILGVIIPLFSAIAAFPSVLHAAYGALMLLNVAIGPMGWVAIGVGTLIALLPNFIKWVSGTTVEIRGLGEEVDKIKGRVDDLAGALTKLTAAEKTKDINDQVSAYTRMTEALKGMAEALVKNDELKKAASGSVFGFEGSDFTKEVAAVQKMVDQLKDPSLTKAMEEFRKGFSGNGKADNWGGGSTVIDSTKAFAGLNKMLEIMKLRLEDVRKVSSGGVIDPDAMKKLIDSVPTAEKAIAQVMKHFTDKSAEQFNPLLEAANEAEDKLTKLFDVDKLGVPTPEQIAKVREWATLKQSEVEMKKEEKKLLDEIERSRKHEIEEIKRGTEALDQWVNDRQSEIDQLEEMDPLLRKQAELLNELFKVGKNADPDKFLDALLKIPEMASKLMTTKDNPLQKMVDSLNLEIEAVGKSSLEINVARMRREAEVIAKEKQIKGSEELINKLEDELRILAKLDMEYKINERIRSVDQSNKLVGLTDDDAAIQRELLDLREEARRAGVELDEQQVSSLERSLQLNQKLTKSWDRTKQSIDSATNALGAFLDDVTFNGKSATAAMEDLLKAFYKIAVQQLVFQPLMDGFKGGLTSGLGSLFSANGNAFDRGGVVPFANGGIVDRPSMFAMRGGRAGVAGEAGPGGILPLKRNASGRLGVEIADGGGRQSSMTININSPDVGGFRRSERQIMNKLGKMRR